MKLSDYNNAFKFYLSQLKPYTILLTIVVVLTLISEGVSAGLRYILKIIIDDVQLYLDSVLSMSDLWGNIFFLSLLTILGVIVYYLSYWLRFHLGNKILTKSSKKSKLLILKHLFTLDYKFFSNEKSGSIITKFTRIDRSMSSLTESLFFSILAAFFQLIISLFLLFQMHYSYALIILFSLLLMGAYNVWLQRKQLPAQEGVNDAEEHENSLVADSFSNIETIKLYAKEQYVQDKFEEKAENTRKKTLFFENYYRWFDSFNNSFPFLVILVIFILSIYFLSQGIGTVGDIFFIQATFFTLIGYVRYVLWMFRSVYTGLVDLDSIVKYLERKPLVTDTKSAKDLTVKNGSILIKDVHFSYNKKQSLMNGVSIDIKPQQSVAFVGKSGSGKSTMVKLLCRFYDVTKGKITIDSQDISKVTQTSLRSNLAFVAQEGILFDDTVYNNIAFPCPSASKKQVMSAIKAAQLEDVINRLPKKEHTLVGERGVKLSGGERQRVSIARAILANRSIVILDEATSALDSVTENKIQKALQELLQKKTSIIIAHRLSTIMHVDNIVVFSKGKVVEQGTHSELLKKKGEYYNLWKMQKDGFM